MSEVDEIMIEPLTMEHVEQVIAVERASFSDPWTRGMFVAELDSAAFGGYARAATRNGRVVGYVFAIFIPDEAHIGNLAVHPDERRHGKGSGRREKPTG